MARKTNLQRALDKRTEARAKLETALIERKLQQFNNKYDAIDPNNAKKRRAPEIEKEKEANIVGDYGRLKAINIGRDQERNFTNAKSIVHQQKINVIGEYPKAQFNSKDKNFNENSSFWFNSVWMKDCDSRDDCHFSELTQLIVSSVTREGDCIVAFDDFDRDDGKLLFWEADQLVEVNEADWKAQTEHVEKVKVLKNGRMKTEKVPYIQDKGILRDNKGRVVGYVVTSKRGQTKVDYKDACILPVGTAKLIKRPWRLNQGRGVGDMLTTSADMEDIYEMRSKELQSAKVAAGMAGIVKKKDPIEEALYKAGTNPDELVDQILNDTESYDTGDAEVNQEDNYERLEALTGGFLEYLGDNDDFEILDFNRPNVSIKDFFEFVQCSSGASHGFAKAYTKLSADSSYTAFRGDMILTWVTFKYLQKWIERRFCDWIVKKAVTWAIRKGKLTKPNDDLWEYRVSWQFPTMPHVDELKEENAITQALKNGDTDFAELLGPNWREKMKAYAEQIEYAKTLGLPLSVFETKSGGITEEQNKKGESEE
jgi:capsid protein